MLLPPGCHHIFCCLRCVGAKPLPAVAAFECEHFPPQYDSLVMHPLAAAGYFITEHIGGVQHFGGVVTPPPSTVLGYISCRAACRSKIALTRFHVSPPPAP